MPIEREKIRSGLLAKWDGKPKSGKFVETGTDHELYRLEIDGRRYAVGTKLSRGTKYKDYSDDLVRDVYRQLGLTKRELTDLLDCNLKMDEYIKLLKDRGRIK